MKIQKILALSTALAIGFSNPQIAFAHEMPSDGELEYLEYHYQVNFDDLDVFVVNGTTLDIASNDGQRTDARTAEAIDALATSLSECNDVEAEIVAMLNDNQQLAVISFTEAPLLLEDNHYERVKVADAENYYKDTNNDKEKSTKGMFTLYTSVFRSSSVDANGNYQYTTGTYGVWSKNSAVGGENYPDSGEDYVLQSTPNNWKRTSHWMKAHYDNTPYDGVSGRDFWSAYGGDNYIYYAILDDPYEFAKARQNTSFTMACTSEGNASASSRLIHSYYYHTWDTIELSVSVSANTKREIELSITATKGEDYWSLYNDLDFNF